jgi:hypothetical protein
VQQQRRAPHQRAKQQCIHHAHHPGDAHCVG